MRNTQERKGTFKATGKGYGFITPDDGDGESCFVPAKYTGNVWTGEHVEFVED